MTPTHVADAGVIIRWFLEQIGYEHAREILDNHLHGSRALACPAIVRYEVADVLRRKGHAQGLLTLDQLLSASGAVDDLGLEIIEETRQEREAAVRLAARYNQRVFDCVYVVTAQRLSVPLLTSDKRLANSLGHLQPVELLRGI